MVSVGSVTQCHYKEELGQSTVINLALRFLLDLNLITIAVICNLLLLLLAGT